MSYKHKEQSIDKEAKKSGDLDELFKICLMKNNLALSAGDEGKLGSGSFGNVWEVTIINNDYKKVSKKVMSEQKTEETKYALKVIIIDKNKEKAFYDKRKKQITRELSLCLNIKHHNIVRTKQTFQTEKPYGSIFMILMDKAKFPNLYFLQKTLYCKTQKENKLELLIYEIANGDGGSKKTEHNQYKWFTRINENFAKFLIKQILFGIEFLHRNNVIHFDMKPGNILITKDMELKICDFTLTTFLNLGKNEPYYLNSGTYPFMSPEYFSKTREIDKSDAPKIDMYALGVMLFQLFFPDKPFEGEECVWGHKQKKPEEKEVRNRIEKVKKIIEDDANLSSECKRVFNKLIQNDIKKRGNIYEILNEDWFKYQNKDFHNIIYTNDDLTAKFIIETMKCDKIKENIKNKPNNNYNKKGFAKIKSRIKRPKIA